MNSESSGSVRKLKQRLSERLDGESNLWTAHWGLDASGTTVPRIIQEIVTDLVSSDSSRTVLVSGTYGLGKSSFLLKIEEGLKTEDRAKKRVIRVKLPMSVLTSHLPSSALAAVTIAITEAVREASEKQGKHFNCQDQIETLWRLETGMGGGGLGHGPEFHAPPEASRMAGRSTNGTEFLKASQLATLIGTQLEDLGHSVLVVFLDDLDRCPRHVAKDVIRLILSFGSRCRVHFVIASDRDVLEQGVKDWMAAFGNGDGGPVVTANSALEKYVHVMVDLPRMGAPVHKHFTMPSRSMEALEGLVEKVTNQSEIENYRNVMLADVLMNWLVEEIVENDLYSNMKG